YKDSIGLNNPEIFKVMKAVGQAGGVVTIHAELGDEIDELRNLLFMHGKTEPKFHPLSRLNEMEVVAVKQAIELAAKADCPLYIVHVSVKKSLKIIKKAQKKAQKVYAESCPHYLLLDDTKYSGNFSQTLKQKEIGLDDFRKIPNGAGGVEHRLALLYTYGVLKNKLSINKFVDLVSTQPAKIFGLYPRKGEIAVGADADIVIWDPTKKDIISTKTHHQNCDINIFEGTHTTGAVEYVILNGEIAIENNKLIKKGKGRFLRR
ncbi:MAG: hypothetical protein B6I20_07750, partial [Bacteroidetes bacterium 4572_117]